ncbi:hypothetical protein UO65_5803 [Actinokineospora spheciospongiae]|uniref:Uncharacterized protein n=1 Tax=Actinokineospora spheciospongiae TaxID=909613 RepID=W7IEH0_9PSEU|nr:hypothetical protein UO65_5803 [Actinokineospora spheciospongiae]
MQRGGCAHGSPFSFGRAGVLDRPQSAWHGRREFGARGVRPVDNSARCRPGPVDNRGRGGAGAGVGTSADMQEFLRFRIGNSPSVM